MAAAAPAGGVALALPRAAPQSKFNLLSPDLSSFLARVATGNQVHEIRLHQAAAAIKTAKHLADPNKTQTALVVLPTGSGKSGVAVLSAYTCNASRVLVITPSAKISEQLLSDFAGGNNAFIFKRSVYPYDVHAAQYIPTCFLLKTNTAHLQATIASHDATISNAHKIGGRSRIRIADIPDVFDLVIVDEAHHYPCDTWKFVVDHFQRAKKLFLTATPSYKGAPIFPGNQKDYIAYELTKEDAINQGLIRPFDFSLCAGGAPGDDEKTAAAYLAAAVKAKLAAHDLADNTFVHQAMILCQTVEGLNSCDAFFAAYNAGVVNEADKCKKYVVGTPKSVVDDFSNGSFRTLVIVGRLAEGYDNVRVSVAGIFRNLRSKIVFNQFVGRACRKQRPGDPVSASIISHVKFGQDALYKVFEDLPEEDDDNEDEDD